MYYKFTSLIGENRQLVTDEPVEFDKLRGSRLPENYRSV